MPSKTIAQRATQVGKLALEADARINGIITKLEEAQRGSPQRNILSFKRPKKKAAKELDALPLFESLRKEFCSAIFPIGASILSTCLECYTGNLLTSKQRDELVGIGNNVLALTFDVLTGKKSLEQGLSDFVEILKELGSFFQNNPEVAIKVGATILATMHPLGLFIKMAVDEIFKSDDISNNLQQGLMGLLKELATSFGVLEKNLEETAENQLDSRKRPRTT